MPKFEILNSKDRKVYFRFKAANGQVLATSETYESKQACNKGIRSLIEGIRQSNKVVIQDLTDEHEG